jgi:hypothetical protein
LFSPEIRHTLSFSSPSPTHSYGFSSRVEAVTVQEQDRLTQLCSLIQNENDPSKFTALIEELTEFLEQMEHHFDEDQRKDPLL